MKNPCNGCERRTITCHGVCPDYKAWRSWKDEKNAIKAEEKRKYGTISESGIRHIYRQIVKKSRGR